MPIDSQIKHLVDYYYSLELPEYNSSTCVEKERARMKFFIQKASKELSPNVEEIEDHIYDTDYGQVKVRSYSPKKSSFKKPLIYFRGSGFVIDNFDDADLMCSKLASHCETTVISIDYPLAPENAFPIPAEACYQTILKIVSDAHVFGIDSKGFVLIGESSGACLAAIVCQMLRDRNGPKMGLQVLIYPVTDNDFNTDSYRVMGNGNILSEAKMRWYLSQYLKKEEDGQKLYAFPMNAKDFSHLPRALIITAGHDPLCDEGKKYADKLKEAGVPTEYICYNDFIHGFLKFNGITNVEKAFVEIVKKVKDFLKS